MERLSEIAIGIINDLHKERLDYYSEYIPLIDATNRLSAYEDTGLTPEEIKAHEEAFVELTTLSYGPVHKKIGKWLKADRDGRLVVLPCKVGDTVYQTDAERIYENNITQIIYDTDGIAFDARAIGKTVFLTRAEAEAALKGGEE